MSFPNLKKQHKLEWRERGGVSEAHTSGNRNDSPHPGRKHLFQVLKKQSPLGQSKDKQSSHTWVSLEHRLNVLKHRIMNIHILSHQ